MPTSQITSAIICAADSLAPNGTAKHDRMALGKRMVIAISKRIPEPNRGFRPYYLFDGNHPIVAELLARYKESNGISTLYPMSDEERMDFELQLVNGMLIREIKRYCDGT